MSGKTTSTDSIVAKFSKQVPLTILSNLYQTKPHDPVLTVTRMFQNKKKTANRSAIFLYVLIVLLFCFVLFFFLVFWFFLFYGYSMVKLTNMHQTDFTFGRVIWSRTFHDVAHL